jgi:hypothetical protein
MIGTSMNKNTNDPTILVDVAAPAGLFVNGSWHPSTTGTGFQVTDSGTGMPIALPETGVIGTNPWLVSDATARFGGIKVSSLGREGGHLGIQKRLETKLFALDLNPDGQDNGELSAT